MRLEDFERIYVEHAERLLNFVLYRTGERAVAEDVVAETFEKAFRARRRFSPRRASEKTWLYTIALNTLRDDLRRRSSEANALAQLAPALPGDSDPGLSGVEERDLVKRGLTRLSAEERDAIALRYGAELSLPEIAKLTGMPLSTAEGRVYGALRKLRDDLREDDRSPVPAESRRVG